MKKLNKNFIQVKTLIDAVNGKVPDQTLMKSLRRGDVKEKDGKKFIVKKIEILTWVEDKPLVEVVSEHLKNTSTLELFKCIKNPNKESVLKNLALTELKSRGEDVSKIIIK